MRTDTPQTIYRKDYTPPSYLVETVEIGFDLELDLTIVANRMTLRRNPASKSSDIVLNGEGLKLIKLRMNGKVLKRSEYKLSKDHLTIANAPQEAVLEIETHIEPSKNTSLSGLYTSNKNFFTQCEAEGFRKITFFPDRPDVMAKYTVMLRANKKNFPVLLANGNLLEEGDLGDGRHYAKWEDPFNKPAYLFAIVAGKLVCQEQKHKLQSGREVLLQVWVEAGNLDKTQHAMDSLVNSIVWDEERYGLELDLDRFMIVAVSDFNMGAMENKGLNIFNTKYVLANARIATDTDFANIESVVGHEYFHNWTGNRITCRDWFQLSLKEGLTVFRDQEFSGDMINTPAGRAVSRIENVRVLRATQFAEDAGPMAHPVRPDSFVEINNFYTVTIYEKGSEVVRMYQTLVGVDGFRKGMDLYFERHDGQAVTCDDFRAAMADANGRDFSQFERWYSQAGTPRVSAKTHYDQANRCFEITLKQSCPATPGQAKKLPFQIPVLTGLLDQDGKDLPLFLEGDSASHGKTNIVLELTKASQVFRFLNVEAEPVPSLLRGFSAPVNLDYAYNDAQLLHLARHDSDAFNRWEAGQRLISSRLQSMIKAAQKLQPMQIDATLIDAMRATLLDDSLDPSFREIALTQPSESTIAEQMSVIDPQAIHRASEFMRVQIATNLGPQLMQTYKQHQPEGAYNPAPAQAARRALKNYALYMMLQCNFENSVELAEQQFTQADNMTDRLAALYGLLNVPSNQASKACQRAASKALARFYKDFQKEALVIDKWFTLQASAVGTDVSAMRKLLEHPAFTYKNPNRVHSAISAFCRVNPAQFHALDGSGYEFWADCVIKLDGINQQLAARVARAMDRWRMYAPSAQIMMESALQRVAKTRNLSNDVTEIISKALASK